MPKILIIGASSFLGKNLIEDLPKSWEIHGSYFNDSAFPEFAGKFSNVKPFRLDISRETITLPSGTYDEVIYLAANSDPRKSAEIPDVDLALNAGGIIKICSAAKFSRLIYISSGSVYNPVPLPYMISKKAGEEYVKYFASAKGFSYIILRLFYVYGPHIPENRLIKKLVNDLAAGRKEFTILGDGKNLINPLYVKDFTSAMQSIISSSQKNLQLDLCSDSDMTLTELISRVAKCFSTKISVKYEGQPLEKNLFHGDNSRFRKLFRFSARSLEEGILDWKKSLRP